MKLFSPKSKKLLTFLYKIFFPRFKMELASLKLKKFLSHFQNKISYISRWKFPPSNLKIFLYFSKKGYPHISRWLLIKPKKTLHTLGWLLIKHTDNIYHNVDGCWFSVTCKLFKPNFLHFPAHLTYSLEFSLSEW